MAVAISISVPVVSKVATVESVLVLVMVAGDVVRVQGRLVVLREVRVGRRHQRRLDQGHVLVQQSVVVIVHAHGPYCNECKSGIERKSRAEKEREKERERDGWSVVVVGFGCDC